MAAGRRMLAALLILAMAIGSIVLWLGIPIGWLYVASRIAKSSQPSMGPYLLILAGIPASMVVVGKLLSRLNRTYAALTGAPPAARTRHAWMKSLRGERDSGRPRTVLDVVMVSSVALALVCLAIWFFVFAGSSLPS
jgi:hypothetical protein